MKRVRQNPAAWGWPQLWILAMVVLALVATRSAIDQSRGATARSISVSSPTLQPNPPADRSAFASAQTARVFLSANDGETSVNDQNDAWLRISPARRAALLSSEAMAPYEPIFASLRLSTVQLRRVKEIIVERAESASDVEDLAKENLLRPAETSALRADAEAFFDRRLEEIAGTENARVLHLMLELAPQLEELSRLMASNPDGTASPLSANQLLALAQIYKNAFSVNASGAPADRTRGFDAQTGLGEKDRKALESAAMVLDPAQLDRLRNQSSILTASAVPTGASD